MLVLTLRTDHPEAEIGLFEDGVQMAYEKWQAHRHLAETIHQKINDLLASCDAQLTNLHGIGIFTGPGSFTGLRIGMSVANALSYSLNIPIAGATGSNWQPQVLDELTKNGQNRMALPEYGSPVHVTPPRK